MYRQVKALGYELTLLSANGERVDMPYDHRFDFDVNPQQCALAREQAWSRFLVDCVGKDETVLMVEPDTYLRKHIPPVQDGKDLVVFKRNMRPAPCCFRITKGSGAPYYVEMARLAASFAPHFLIWYCDIEAQETMLGYARDPMHVPAVVAGCRIEVRDTEDYCMEKNKQAFASCFNGNRGKKRMLKLA